MKVITFSFPGKQLDVGFAHFYSFHKDARRTYCITGTILAPANKQWTKKKDLCCPRAHKPIGERQITCRSNNIVEVRWPCVLCMKKNRAEKVNRESGRWRGCLWFSVLWSRKASVSTWHLSRLEGGESESCDFLGEGHSRWTKQWIQRLLSTQVKILLSLSSFKSQVWLWVGEGFFNWASEHCCPRCLLLLLSGPASWVSPREWKDLDAAQGLLSCWECAVQGSPSTVACVLHKPLASINLALLPFLPRCGFSYGHQPLVGLQFTLWSKARLLPFLVCVYPGSLTDTHRKPRLISLIPGISLLGSPFPPHPYRWSCLELCALGPLCRILWIYKLTHYSQLALSSTAMSIGWGPERSPLPPSPPSLHPIPVLIQAQIYDVTLSMVFENGSFPLSHLCLPTP